MIPHGEIPPQNLPHFGVPGVNRALFAAVGNPVGILLQALERWFLAHFEPHLQPQVRQDLFKETLVLLIILFKNPHMKNAGFPLCWVTEMCYSKVLACTGEGDIYFQPCRGCWGLGKKLGNSGSCPRVPSLMHRMPSLMHRVPSLVRAEQREVHREKSKCFGKGISGCMGVC